MEKNLYLTSKEYAVLLHLTGNRAVTGFAIDFPTDTAEKRKILFGLYRKGIVCNTGSEFKVADEWREVFRSIQTAQKVLWMTFEEEKQPDLLFYVCSDNAVCIENLTDTEHDCYRISMRENAVWRNDLIERELFPNIRTDLSLGELLDRGLGVEDSSTPETVVTFSMYQNGADTRTEKVSLEKENLIYYVKYEAADGVTRKRAHKTEIEEILKKYL